MAPILHIRLLGTFSLVYDAQPVTSLQASRLQSLLAYLLLHPDIAQLRQQIAFQFWPETTDGQAQTNLRQLLRTLRLRLPDAEHYLEITSSTIRWSADASYCLDVAEFQSALAQSTHVSASDQIPALLRAVDLYTGDLLPGCYDDWILPQRERLAQHYLAALHRLIALLAEGRDYLRTIDYAQRLLRYDPLHEATYGLLMQIYAATGDRAAALRVYHTCATLLSRELGVDPSLSTRTIYEQLLHAEHPPLPGNTARSVPLVARSDEWRALQLAWNSARQGLPHFVCISGEAGIGKSRLAEEMVRWAQQQGFTTLHMRAYGAEGALAYAPLAELLRTDLLALQMARLDPLSLIEVARIHPELLSARPELLSALPSSQPPLPEQVQRQRLFEALARTFLSERRPTLLLLDDLQWFDRETLEWLHFLMRYDHQAPLMVIGTLRPEELLSDHPAAQALSALHMSQVAYSELHLERLNAHHTAQLATELVERELAQPLLDQIYHATEGNPFFVVETVRAHLAFPKAEAATTKLDSGPPTRFALTPKVHTLLRSRLRQLTPTARELAATAAVFGRSFTFNILMASTGQDEDTIIHSLDELWQRHIVRAHGRNAYDFSHDLLREVAYRELSPMRRQRIHQSVAKAIEKIHLDDIDPVSAQLAHHYEQASEPERAIQYLQRAAAAAQCLFAYHDAIAYLDHAITLIHALPANQVRVERELELQMMLCSNWAIITNHMGKEAETSFARALSLCYQLPLTPHLFTVFWGLHEIALYRADFPESIALAQRCLQIAKQSGEPDLHLHAHHALWGAYHLYGDQNSALKHAQLGLTLYRQEDHELSSAQYAWHDTGACALEIASLALWQMGLLDQASRKNQELIAHTARLTQPSNIGDGSAYIALFCHLMAAPAMAQPFAQEAYRIGVECGLPGLRITGAVTLGWSTAMQGQSEVGIALLWQGLAEANLMGQRHHASQFAIMAAQAYMAAGRTTEAVAHLDRAIAAFHSYRDVICAPDLWTLKAVALQSLGAPQSDVEECHITALSVASELGAQTSQLRAATARANLLRHQGRKIEAYRLLSPIYDLFVEGFDKVELCDAQHLLTALVA